MALRTNPTKRGSSLCSLTGNKRTESAFRLCPKVKGQRDSRTERDRERERARERARQRDRERERPRETETERDRERERQTEKERERQSQRDSRTERQRVPTFTGNLSSSDLSKGGGERRN